MLAMPATRRSRYHPVPTVQSPCRIARSGPTAHLQRPAWDATGEGMTPESLRIPASRHVDTIERARAHLQCGQVDTALALVQQLLADHGAPAPVRLRTLLLAAQVNSQGTTLETAFELAAQAAALAQKLGDAASHAEALCLQASVRLRLGLARDALDDAVAALAQARAAGTGRVESLALRTMGNCALQQDDADAARRLLDDSLACARRAGDDECEFWALNNLSDLLGTRAAQLAESGDIARARPLIDELHVVVGLALQVAQRTGHWLQRAFALSNLADAHIVLGEHRRARELVDAYAQLAKEGGSVRLLAYANLDAVRMLRAEGRLDLAVALLDSDAHRALLAHNSDIAQTTETALYDMHKRQGHFEAALRHHEMASQMHVQQLTRRADQQARVMMMHLEVEQARAAADRARLDAELSARRAQLLELERDQLHRASREDVLTGTGNRRAADEALAQNLRESPGDGAICVSLIDLDHFKGINDRLGHAVGALLLQGLRGQDRVYRYGGEEFLVILGASAAATAGEVCERLRQTIAGHDWRGIASGLAVTASFGWASHRPGESQAALLQRADAALYRAKTGGRNQVVAAG